LKVTLRVVSGGPSALWRAKEIGAFARRASRRGRRTLGSVTRTLPALTITLADGVVVCWTCMPARMPGAKPQSEVSHGAFRVVADIGEVGSGDGFAVAPDFTFGHGRVSFLGYNRKPPRFRGVGR
jgi:hypothetical protein